MMHSTSHSPFGFDPFPAAVALGLVAALLALVAPTLPPLVAALGAIALAAWMADRVRRAPSGRRGPRSAEVVAVAVVGASITGVLLRPDSLVALAASESLAAALVGLWALGRPSGARTVRRSR